MKITKLFKKFPVKATIRRLLFVLLLILVGYALVYYYKNYYNAMVYSFLLALFILVIYLIVSIKILIQSIQKIATYQREIIKLIGTLLTKIKDYTLSVNEFNDKIANLINLQTSIFKNNFKIITDVIDKLVEQLRGSK